jgi:hypothetical protein
MFDTFNPRNIYFYDGLMVAGIKVSPATESMAMLFSNHVTNLQTSGFTIQGNNSCHFLALAVYLD